MKVLIRALMYYQSFERLLRASFTFSKANIKIITVRVNLPEI